MPLFWPSIRWANYFGWIHANNAVLHASVDTLHTVSKLIHIHYHIQTAVICPVAKKRFQTWEHERDSCLLPMESAVCFPKITPERCCFIQTPGLRWITTRVFLFLRYRSLFWITGLLITSQIPKHFGNITFECFPLCPDIYRTSTSFWSFEHFWKSNITEAGLRE